MSREKLCDNCENYDIRGQCTVPTICKNQDLYVRRLSICVRENELNKQEIIKRLTKHYDIEYKITITKNKIEK